MTTSFQPDGIRMRLFCTSITAVKHDVFRATYAGNLGDPPLLTIEFYSGPRNEDRDSLPRVGCYYDLAVTPIPD